MKKKIVIGDAERMMRMTCEIKRLLSKTLKSYQHLTVNLSDDQKGEIFYFIERFHCFKFISTHLVAGKLHMIP